MASLTPIYKARYGSEGYGLRFREVVVEDADADDTVTISELSSITDTVALSLVDGGAVACSEATNVVTIDPAGALSGEDVRIIVSGH
jgi:hypothetical protein